MTTYDHSIQGLNGHLWLVTRISEVPLFVLRKTCDNLLLVAELVVGALDQSDNLLLDLLVVKQELLQEFVKLRQGSVSLNPTCGRAVSINRLVVNFKDGLVLCKDAARRLLLNVFEKLLDVWHLTCEKWALRTGPHEVLELVALDQEWDLRQLQNEPLKVEASFDDKSDIFVANKFLGWRAWDVNTRPVSDDDLSE